MFGHDHTASHDQRVLRTVSQGHEASPEGGEEKAEKHRAER